MRFGGFVRDTYRVFRMRLMTKTNKRSILSKVSIIIAIEDESLRIKLMQSTEGLSSRDKAKIIKTIKDDSLRISTMQSTEGLSSRDKAEIIKTIENEPLRISTMQSTEGLSSRDKAEIIEKIENDSLRISTMQSTEGLSSRDKAEIIETIENEPLRISTMQSTEGLSSRDKAEIIETIKDESLRISVMKSTDGLESIDKARIIKSVKDKKIKLSFLNSLDRNKEDSYDSADLIILLGKESAFVLQQYLLAFSDSISNNEIAKIIKKIAEQDVSKIKELMENSQIPEDAWNIYKGYYCNDTDFIDENLQFFIEKGIHTKDKDKINSTRETILRMSKKNGDVILKLDFRILSEKYMDVLGEERINLISCYPEIQKKIVELNNTQLMLLGKCIDEYIEQLQTDEWTPIFNQLLEHIGEYDKLINSLGINNKEDFNNLSVQDIKNLIRIMQDANWCEIESLEEVRDYYRIREQKCNELMESEDSTLEQKKWAVFQKLFGHSLLFAGTMVERYGEDIENIDDCEMKDYIKSLKAILEVNDEELLKEIFEQCEYAELDKIAAERELKTQYFKKYLSDLYIPKEEDRVEGTTNIYEAGTDFRIIMTSVRPYSNWYYSKIDNYKEDWNMPKIASQAICCSYIRNDMIGIPRISSICYGFSCMREDALMRSGVTDLASEFEEFEASVNGRDKYYTPDSQINNTSDRIITGCDAKKAYNEMDFRRIQNGIKVQPDYIVVFREGNIIENMEEAKRASEEWGEIPIVIVDVDKCLEEERRKVDEMITEYDQEPTLEQARKIAQKVRNNRITNKEFCSDIDSRISEFREIMEKESKENKTTVQESENNVGQNHLEETKENGEEVVLSDWRENYERVKSATEKVIEGNRIRKIYQRLQEIARGKYDERQQ